VFCSLATLSGFLRQGRIWIPPRGWSYAAAAALALFGAFVLLMQALALGPASVLVPVAQMGFVITALFGIAVFRERVDLRKCVGLAVAVVVLALFVIS
jgi:uncharacterized membrane protein